MLLFESEEFQEINQKIWKLQDTIVFEDIKDDYQYFLSLVEKYHPQGMALLESVKRIPMKDNPNVPGYMYQLSRAAREFLDFLMLKYSDQIYRSAVFSKVILIARKKSFNLNK